jgi:hypothetical protein
VQACQIFRENLHSSSTSADKGGSASKDRQKMWLCSYVATVDGYVIFAQHDIISRARGNNAHTKLPPRARACRHRELRITVSTMVYSPPATFSATYYLSTYALCRLCTTCITSTITYARVTRKKYKSKTNNNSNNKISKSKSSSYIVVLKCS